MSNWDLSPRAVHVLLGRCGALGFSTPAALGEPGCRGRRKALATVFAAWCSLLSPGHRVWFAAVAECLREQKSNGDCKRRDGLRESMH
jgi:hypothetical protein